jgi:hypothetical protein
MNQTMCDFLPQPVGVENLFVRIPVQEDPNQGSRDDLRCGKGKCYHCSCTAFDGGAGDEYCKCGHRFVDHHDF